MNSGMHRKGSSVDCQLAVRRVCASGSGDEEKGLYSGSPETLVPQGCVAGVPVGSTVSSKAPAFCRICLETKAVIQDEQLPGSTLPWFWRPKPALEDDRLISPCACTGTQAFVHYACLRTWQKSVLSSSRLSADLGGSSPVLSAASVCSVCTQRFSVQPPPIALHIRIQRLAELYARELIWFFLFLCIFYFFLACNLGNTPLLGNTLNSIRSAMGLPTDMSQSRDPLGPGTVLVASPTKMSQSSIFFRSVVVISENDSKNGAAVVGVIINKPTKEDSEEEKEAALELPLFLDKSKKQLPRLLGWGGPLSRSSILLMDMCPCCMQDPSTVSGQPQCCACACRSSHELEQRSAGHWARFVFPGLFLGTDAQSLLALEQTESAKDRWRGPLRCGAGAPQAETVFDFQSNASRVLLMGHATWQPGQLEAEIRAGWWLVLSDIHVQDVFSMPLKLLWKSLVAAHLNMTMSID